MKIPKSTAEIEEVEIQAGAVINGVDSPYIMSVDSTESIETDVEKEKLSEGDIDASKDESESKEKGEESKKDEETIKTKEKIEKTDDSVKKESLPDTMSEDSKTVQKRIGKLTKKWRTAERERDFEREKRKEVEEKLKEAAAQIPAADKPQKENFDDEDAYIEALTDWKSDIKLKESQQIVTQEIKDKDEQKAVDETYDGLDETIEKGKEKYDNFNDLVMDGDLIISPEVTQILLDSDVPEDILYHLASNPDESERISKLDPVRIAKELGKIEVRLEKKEEKEIPIKPKKEKKQSKAPKPIESIRTDGVTEQDPNTMSPKEYRAWRMKS